VTTGYRVFKFIPGLWVFTHYIQNALTLCRRSTCPAGVLPDQMAGHRECHIKPGGIIMISERTLPRQIHVLMIIIFISFFFIPLAEAASEENGLTFINKSGEDALVKLVGPSRKVVQVENGKEKRVEIASGSYYIYVRYGDLGHYRYAKGETFGIEDVVNGYVEAELTLHGVVNGNYVVRASSEEEFNRY